ncbi:MAG: AAA family ATPase [Lachnospiraceae bacterium]|nr:AAA family ATPase [Lachnospiraceae bacterium]
MEPGEHSLAARFQNLIVKAVETTGRNAVVLVDEYDKPLLEVGNEERNVLVRHGDADLSYREAQDIEF